MNFSIVGSLKRLLGLGNWNRKSQKSQKTLPLSLFPFYWDNKLYTIRAESLEVANRIFIHKVKLLSYLEKHLESR